MYQNEIDQIIKAAETFDKAIFSIADMIHWQDGALEHFIEQGILKSIEPAKEAECDGCDERCVEKVEFVDGKKPSDTRAFIICKMRDDMAPIEVDMEKLKRWKVDKDKLKELDYGKEQKSNISGMTWQEAKKKAEAIVNEKGYLGFGKLIEAVGCSEGTLRKVITEKSSFLKQEKETYESISKTLRAVGLTAKVVATYETSSEPKLSDTEADEIIVEMLKRIKQEQPNMFETTKEQLNKMNPDQKREFAKVYQRDYQNKKSTLKKSGPKTQRQYKQV